MTGTARTIVPLLVALGLLASDALPAAGTEADEVWERARSAEFVAHAGEIVAVTYAGGRPHRMRMSVEEAGRGLLLPAGAQDAEDLERKYRLETAGRERVLDRPATGIEVYRRDGGTLRERLWVDDATGLVLRRERYDGDTLLSLVAFERLDPSVVQAPRPEPALAPIELDVPLPAELPGGYRLAGPAGLSGPHGEAVRVAYDDGLYRVSVFAQPGRPDTGALPPGARAVDGLPGPAYDWPGALPQRLVWEAGDTTWTLVGDPPPDEFRALALALPQPQRRTPLRRLRTGLGRLWSSLSPFD